MPFQAWIRHDSRKELFREQCFNGAMPFQAWIPEDPRILPSINMKLQWGHALSGMDTSVALTTNRQRCGRFNGAMPFQAWILR